MKKTHIIILSALALLIIFLVFVWYKQKRILESSRALGTNNVTAPATMTASEKSTRDKFASILAGLQGNASNNPLTYDTLVSALTSNGISAYKTGETHTMQYDVNRVEIIETPKQCITSPCFNDFAIVSVG